MWKTAQKLKSFSPEKNGVENDLMMYNGFCPACGGAIFSRGKRLCPTCRVSLTKPEPKRVAREIGIYLAFFRGRRAGFRSDNQIATDFRFFAALLQGVFAVRYFSGFGFRRGAFSGKRT